MTQAADADASASTIAEISAGESSRLAGLGAAKRRLAAVHARAGRQQAMVQAIQASREYYQKAAGLAPKGPNTPVDPHTDVSAYPALNWLFLELLLTPKDPPRLLDEVATRCIIMTEGQFQRHPSFWNATRTASFVVFRKILDAVRAGDEGATAGEAGDAALVESLYSGYREALEGTTVTPRELVTVVSHLQAIGDLFGALAKEPVPGSSTPVKTFQRVGTLLIMLASRLRGNQ
jgi:hypothetical protein